MILIKMTMAAIDLLSHLPKTGHSVCSFLVLQASARDLLIKESANSSCLRVPSAAATRPVKCFRRHAAAVQHFNLLFVARQTSGVECGEADSAIGVKARTNMARARSSESEK